MLAGIASVDRGLPPRSRLICSAWTAAFFRVFRDASAVLGCTFPVHVMDIAATSKLGANCPSDSAEAGVVRNRMRATQLQIALRILRLQPQLSATYSADGTAGIAADGRIRFRGLGFLRTCCVHIAASTAIRLAKLSAHNPQAGYAKSVPFDQFAHFCLNQSVGPTAAAAAPPSHRSNRPAPTLLLVPVAFDPCQPWASTLPASRWLVWKRSGHLTYAMQRLCAQAKACAKEIEVLPVE